ncbi:MAG: TolB family protein [Vicinamibacteria bacterium]
MTYEDILGLKRPSDPQIAPDGSRIVFVVEEWNKEEDSYNQDLYLASVRVGDITRLTYHPKNDAHPRWNPERDSVAFLSQREDNAKQVFFLTFPGGEPTQLTHHKKSVESFAWSSDGNTIFFVAPVPDDQEEEKERKTKKVILVDEKLPFAHIWKLDVASGATTQLTKGEFHVVEIDPSPNEVSIAFIRQATPKIADLLTRELYVTSLDGGEPERMTRNGYAEARPRWSADGNRIAYLSEADGNPSAGPSRIHCHVCDRR